MRMFARFFLTLFLPCLFLAVCTTSIAVAPKPSTNPAATETASPAPSPTLIKCTQSRGHFDYQQIQTSLMTHPLQFRVYLPACYGNDEDRRYPVLYLLHGQSFNDDQWDRLGADEAMDELIASGEIQPFILVLPQESNYMITQWQSKYGQALAAELVVWVDAHYQTCTDRVCRAIGGLSRGAGWAMRIGLMEWETFSAIGAHSFAPFRGDFNAVPLWIKDIPDGKLPRIWIDVGNRDFIADAAKVWKNRLDDYQVPHEWHVFPGSHTEKYWSDNVTTYLRWYAAGWKDISSVLVN